MRSIVKPEFCTKKHLKFLDELRESALTNMFGAEPYLLESFPELTNQEGRAVLLYWMESFGERKE